MVTMVNPMLDGALPLLNILLPLSEPDQARELDLDYGDRLSALFQRVCQQWQHDGVREVDVVQGQFALTAFIDEQVMLSHWPGREQWLMHPLQQRYFFEHMAGVNYFSRIELLFEDEKSNIDVIELYYACLQLGFMGQYQSGDAEPLLSIKRRLQQSILATRRSQVEKENAQMPMGKKQCRWHDRPWPLLWALLSGAIGLAYYDAMHYHTVFNETLHTMEGIWNEIPQQE